MENVCHVLLPAKRVPLTSHVHHVDSHSLLNLPPQLVSLTVLWVSSLRTILVHVSLPLIHKNATKLVLSVMALLLQIVSPVLLLNSTILI